MGEDIPQRASSSCGEQLLRDGFEVDQWVRKQLLKPGVACWRSRLTQQPVPTQRRREIDIVVYRDDLLAGLIETEDDLGHLSHNRMNSKESRYDVLSIDRAPAGGHYYSYNSLERMATACRENNLDVPLFLVVGCIRKKSGIDDEVILAPRLRALRAELIYKEAERN